MQTTNISDHTAGQVLNLAKIFFSSEENVRKFEEWHLKTYGHPYKDNITR